MRARERETRNKGRSALGARFGHQASCATKNDCNTRCAVFALAGHTYTDNWSTAMRKPGSIRNQSDA